MNIIIDYDGYQFYIDKSKIAYMKIKESKVDQMEEFKLEVHISGVEKPIIFGSINDQQLVAEAREAFEILK
jgi:hypothetical protein